MDSLTSTTRPLKNETQPTSTTGRSTRQELFETGFNRLIQALKITKEFSSPCPPLQTAVGALLIALEAYEKYSDAMEALDSLLTRMEPLQKVIRKALEVEYDKCPKALKERLEAFASQVLSVVDDVKAIRSRRRIIRFINASDYAEQTEAWVKKLSWSIQSFILEGTIVLELTVHEGFTMMHGRFDRLDNGIKEVSEGIQGLRDDLDHKLADDPLRTRLRPVLEARFDHGSSIHVECHEGTRGEVLATLCSWLRPDDPRLSTLPEPVVPAESDRPILWVYALPGVGKSTIARTAAVFWERDRVLGATFFCARDGQRSNILGIFRTIAYQLARRFPKFRDALVKVLDEDPDLYAAAPSRQLEKLIAEPIQVAVAEGEFHSRIPIIIDALDECTDKAAVSTILTSLALHISKLEPLWFLITSRREENITRGFLHRTLLENTQQLNLTDVRPDLTKRDIETFVRSRFEDIRRAIPGIRHSWPSRAELDNLLRLSDVLFIYAATAMLFIADDKVRDPEGQLNRLLASGNAAAISGTGSTFLLDTLYEQVLNDAIVKLHQNLQTSIPRLLLGTLVVAEERLDPATLAALLDLPSLVVQRVLPAFHAILTVPTADENTTPIRLIHLSFANFLVDPTRCANERFLVHPPIHHSLIALRCLNLMQESLKYNVCEISSEHDHLPNREIPGLSARIARYLPPVLRYACRYWTRHLARAEIGEELLVALEAFCRAHLLHWLEVLSVLDSVAGVAESLRSTQALLKNADLRETEVPALLYECERMVRAFYPAISTSFIQVYRTAIPFSPAESPLRRRHQADVSQVVDVRIGGERSWSTILASQVVGVGTILALAFSPDGTHVVCATTDRLMLLLNAHTGVRLQVFEGHTNWIRSVSFSPTGKELLSGSDDKTVRLWDVATGACLQTWTVRSHAVGSVAWSPDGVFIAYGAQNRTITLRRVVSSKRNVVLRQDACARYVAFGADGSLLSTSDNMTCNIWDTHSINWGATDNAPSQILEHSSEVTVAAVSSDSSLVACGLRSGEIVLWRKADKQQLSCLPGESDVISLAFYSNSRLAAAYGWSPSILWDVSSVTPIRVDAMDIAKADAASFSPDGVHIAYAIDSTLQIRRWSGNTPRETGVLKPPTKPSLAKRLKRLLGCFSPPPLSSSSMEEVTDDIPIRVLAVSISPRGTLMVAVYEDHWRQWDISSGQCTRTKEHVGSELSTIAWSFTGEYFACTGQDENIRIWDTHTGNQLGTYAGHSSTVTAIVFTADDQHFLSASRDGSIRRWVLQDTRPEASSEVVFQSAEDEIDAFAVSPDGRWMLAGASRHESPPDTSSAELLAKPSRRPADRNGWYGALYLYDATGRVVWIENHRSIVSAVAFSHDCTRALAGSVEGEVFLYDLTQLIPLDKATVRRAPPIVVPEHRFNIGSTHRVRHVSFALNGQGILTDKSYNPLTAELRPLSVPVADPSSPSPHFLDDDGWLWLVDAKQVPRRVCWVSPSARPTDLDAARSWISQQNRVIACRTHDGRLVVIDISRC
ncbi:WD40 repeat-like protein [Trametes coccinea BRFM310]|uniref:WD40 repeat-like protein n=1 Tax=Trametes coccinea (strain BRFM310) TaxID=1353009 RepID=A0A1Y2ID98_TRAC3|nr:WD40 repeat-like protein [Trametes coccinea BRFM310]